MAKAKAAPPQAGHYAGIGRVTYLSTNIGRGCEHCGHPVGCPMDGRYDLADSINHFIAQHGYRLLHVGTETSYDGDGKPWHSTVAVLGAADVPAPLPDPGPITLTEGD